ncbi:MAG TPA: hypothetical protein VF461_17700 [Gemmatimonadaceae bacterium]
MRSAARSIRQVFARPTSIGIGVSRNEIRIAGVNRSGVLIWYRSFARNRSEESLAAVVEKALAERPLVLRGRVRVACVVGTLEAQLRPLHGLPRLHSEAEQIAVVAESLDRFFVGAGGQLRLSAPIRVGDAFWVAAIDHNVMRDLAQACHAQHVRLVGVAPVAAALGHLADPDANTDGSKDGAHLHLADDGARLHVVYDSSGMPRRIWRERAVTGTPSLGGAVRLPDRIEPAFADAYAATRLHSSDSFVLGEHADAVRRATFARRRAQLWIAIAVAGLVAAAWAPGALASRRANRARAQLSALSRKQHELRTLQSTLATSTATLGSVASFERSRHSATLLLAELAMALPESTAITAFHADSLGGTLTVLAPRAAGALEAISDIPLMSRVQMAGPVMREIVTGVELERASLRFTYVRGSRGTR